MQDAFNAKSNVEKVDIKKVMNAWVTQTCYPIVTVRRDYVTGKTTISQQSYNVFGAPGILYKAKWWWIPVTWAKQSSPNFHNTTPTLWLGPEDDTSITVNPDEWIIVNLQQSGKY